jgi:hypothetical protein
MLCKYNINTSKENKSINKTHYDFKNETKKELKEDLKVEEKRMKQTCVQLPMTSKNKILKNCLILFKLKQFFYFINMSCRTFSKESVSIRREFKISSKLEKPIPI